MFQFLNSSLLSSQVISPPINMDPVKSITGGALSDPSPIPVDSQLEKLSAALKDGGAFQFADLTSPDPYNALPFMAAAIIYLGVDRAIGPSSPNSAQGASNSHIAQGLSSFVQHSCILMFPVFATLPAGVQLYAATSGACGLAQGEAFRSNRCEQVEESGA